MSQEKIQDRLVKSTIRIINQDKEGNHTVGTGFFFSYNPDITINARIEAIVTNKHVVENAQVLKLSFRTQLELDEIGTKQDSVKNYDLKNPFEWIYNHPNPDVDLCIIFLKPLKDYFLQHKEQFDISFFEKSLIPDDKFLNQLSAIEDVIMIGYPVGIIEPKKLYPIVRKGITATPYHIDFNGKKDFLTDIFAIGGSSGSPVILYRNNNMQPYLLGIHYAGLSDNTLNLGLNTKSQQIIEIFETYYSSKIQDPKQREFIEKFKNNNNK